MDLVVMLGAIKERDGNRQTQLAVNRDRWDSLLQVVSQLDQVSIDF